MTYRRKSPYAERKAKFIDELPKEFLGTKVHEDEVRRFVVRIMVTVGALPRNIGTLSDLLVEADMRGCYSQGLNMLEMYMYDVETGAVDGAAEPEIIKENSSTALVDGKNGLGPGVGVFCMELAMVKAHETGVGFIVAKGSNHYGIGTWYARLANDESCVGVTWTNTPPLVAPTRAKKAAIGTNPIAISAMGMMKEFLIVDTTLCTADISKIEELHHKEEPIPEGWGLNSEGQPTTDPAEVMEGGSLTPLGGSELTAGYKGYGLAMALDVLCSGLSGSTIGPNIRKWRETDRPADLGQCFLAIDKRNMADGFENRVKVLTKDMRDTRMCKRIDPDIPVMCPGEKENAIYDAVTKDRGIVPYDLEQIQDFWLLAKMCGVAPMMLLKNDV